MHTHKLNNILYFPYSPVNILSATALVESMKYNEGTLVLKKVNIIYFTWYFGKYKKTNSSLRKVSFMVIDPIWIYQMFWFFNRVGSISRDPTFNFSFVAICTRKEPITGYPTDFNTDVDDEVIMEEVSHRLDITIVNPSNKFSRDSNQTKTPTSTFHIGDSLRYTNEGHNEMV